MHDNFVDKLKTAAAIMFGLGIFGSIFFAALTIINQELIWLPLCLAGLFLSWLLYLVVAGFGHLIENSDIMVEELEKISNKQDPLTK